MKIPLVALVVLASSFTFLAAAPTASACVSFTAPGCNYHCTYVDGACVPTPTLCCRVCTDSTQPCPAMPFAPVNLGYVSIQFAPCGGAPRVTVHPDSCEIETQPCALALP